MKKIIQNHVMIIQKKNNHMRINQKKNPIKILKTYLMIMIAIVTVAIRNLKRIAVAKKKILMNMMIYLKKAMTLIINAQRINPKNYLKNQRRIPMIFLVVVVMKRK